MTIPITTHTVFSSSSSFPPSLTNQDLLPARLIEMLHFREPKYPHWGFDSPNPNLIKVVIDLRPSQMNWQRSAQSPLANVSNTSGQLSFPASSTHKEGERFLNFPPLIVS